MGGNDKLNFFFMWPKPGLIDYQILVSIFVPTFEHLNFLKRSFDPKGPHQFSSDLK